MTDVFTFLNHHWTDLLEVVGALYAVAVLIVAMTPSPDDDAWLRRLAERLSFLSPPGSKSKLSLPGASPKRPPPPVERVTLPEAES